MTRVRIVGQKRTFKEFIADTSDDIREWWNQNKDWSIIVIPIAGSLATIVLRGGFKLSAKAISAIKDGMEIKKLNRRIYDPSNGMYIWLKSDMKTADVKRLNDLRKEGLTLIDALQKIGKI